MAQPPRPRSCPPPSPPLWEWGCVWGCADTPDALCLPGVPLSPGVPAVTLVSPSPCLACFGPHQTPRPQKTPRDAQSHSRSGQHRPCGQGLPGGGSARPQHSLCPPSPLPPTTLQALPAPPVGAWPCSLPAFGALSRHHRASWFPFALRGGLNEAAGQKQVPPLPKNTSEKKPRPAAPPLGVGAGGVLYRPPAVV